MKTEFKFGQDNLIHLSSLQVGDWAQLAAGEFTGTVLFVALVAEAKRLINMADGSWYDDLPSQPDELCRRFDRVTITLEEQ